MFKCYMINYNFNDEMKMVTLMRGMPCSWHSAVTSFLYIGSSQFSARMQRRACLLSRALAASLRPLARPSAIKAWMVGLELVRKGRMKNWKKRNFL